MEDPTGPPYAIPCGAKQGDTPWGRRKGGRRGGKKEGG